MFIFAGRLSKRASKRGKIARAAAAKNDIKKQPPPPPRTEMAPKRGSLLNV